MRNNHLQRLLPPPGSDNWGGAGTFNGMPKNLLEKMLKIANFDYMAEAEFELGVIPKSIRHIGFNRPAYQLHEVEINRVKFFIIIQKEKLNDYVKNIGFWGQRNWGNGFHGLSDILCRAENEHNIQGWLDIDDNVMFFINKDMADKMDKFLVFQ